MRFGYTISRRRPRQYVVFDHERGIWRRGRFHTHQQAREFVDDQKRRRLLVIIHGRGMMPGRARAFLITDSDYAGSNERRIRETTRILTR